MFENLIGEFGRPRAQERVLAPDVGDVGIDGDPAALRQGRAFDRDGPPVRPDAFHVMRLEGARLVDADAHRLFGILDIAVFAAQDEIADGILERGAAAGQGVRQVEHLLVLAVRHGEPQVAVEDRQGLLNEVQPRLGEAGARIVRHHLPLLSSNR